MQATLEGDLASKNAEYEKLSTRFKAVQEEAGATQVHAVWGGRSPAYNRLMHAHAGTLLAFLSCLPLPLCLCSSPFSSPFSTCCLQAANESKLAKLQAHLEDATQRHSREMKQLLDKHEREHETFVERTGQVGLGRKQTGLKARPGKAGYVSMLLRSHAFVSPGLLPGSM